MYFINHKEGTTTWIDPRDAMTKKMTWGECGEDEIPYGWEVRVDEKLNMKYWIDHNNQVNTIDDPRLADHRKDQELQLKTKVSELKKATSCNRKYFRSSIKKLDDAKKKLEEAKEADDSESEKQARMAYRVQLSKTNNMERIVEEGEAKIEALEGIDLNEMTMQDALEVKSELAILNENYKKELEEKEKIKSELQDLKNLVAEYMSSMQNSGQRDSIKVKKEAPQKDALEVVAEAKPLAESKGSTLTASLERINELQQKHPGLREIPAGESSVELKIELQQRKLERERQRKETEELRAAQRELRILKEKVAEESKKDSLPYHEIQDEDLPDWLFSSHVVKLLDIEGNKFDNDRDLQNEIQGKVKTYMAKQKEDADSLNFKSKLAFFTTLEIHDDVERRKSDKQMQARSRAASGTFLK